MRKKVLFLITKGNFGGAQRYVYDLATSLPKTKYEAVVACGPGGLLIEKLKEAGIKTIEIESSEREINLKREFKTLKEIVRIIKEEEPDIVHLNSSKMAGLGALAVLYFKLTAPSYKLKAIFTSHGWGFYESHRSGFQKLFYYVSHWITILLCHKTITVSAKTKRDMVWLPFMKGKMVVVHNGIEKFELLERENAREKLAGEEKNKVIIFSISELHKNKGLDVAINGLKLLPQEIKNEIIYCIAGTGEEETSLKLLAKSLELGDKIKFLGFVQDAKNLLSGADLFLFPSRTENLPFAVLEAGLASLPVIATGVGGIPEIVTDMKTGILVHKENAREIAHAIEYMLKNKTRAEEFGKKIHTTVSKNFSKAKMLRETLVLYQ